MNKYVNILVAETLGTFILIITILATGKAIPIGIALAAAIFVASFGSGAHFNPAVTLVMAVKGTIKAHISPLYFFGQATGALLALYWYRSSDIKLSVHK